MKRECPVIGTFPPYKKDSLFMSQPQWWGQNFILSVPSYVFFSGRSENALAGFGAWSMLNLKAPESHSLSFSFKYSLGNRTLLRRGVVGNALLLFSTLKSTGQDGDSRGKGSQPTLLRVPFKSSCRITLHRHHQLSFLHQNGPFYTTCPESYKCWGLLRHKLRCR